MRTWVDPTSVAVHDDFRGFVGGHPLVAETLIRRGINNVTAARAFFDYSQYIVTPSESLPGMTKAVERLEKAIFGEEAILVWGDFDVDGQTATTLLVSTLRELGAKVSYHIPVRSQESHGVHKTTLQQFLEQGIQLLLTCDTGISSHEAVTFAAGYQVETIITDHHNPPEPLPAAYVTVNPKLLHDDGHPLYYLPGVGVAYKLAEALNQRMRHVGATEKLLDLVALGIVADVVPLVKENRYLLQLGLETIRRTDRTGLKVLMQQAEIDVDGLTEDHIGFMIGPRMNALGRLSDANPIVDLLTTKDITKARILVAEIEGLNLRRKMISDQVFQAIKDQVTQEPSTQDSAALVLSHPKWPAGIIGIIASRMVDFSHKPVVLISSPPGEIARGSARSIEGIDITQAIASQSHLLGSFGGHPKAAGFSLRPERISEFRSGLLEAIQNQIQAQPIPNTLNIDGYLPLSDLNLDLAVDLERIAPFGEGNPPLVIVAQNLELKDHRSIGKNGEHQLVQVASEDGYTQDAIWWQSSPLNLPDGKFDLAFTIRSHNFQGRPSLQVEWLEARPSDQGVVQDIPSQSSLQIFDHRHEQNPWILLQRLSRQPDTIVWREGPEVEKIPGADRFHLSHAREFVIWTTPPGQDVLQNILESTRPQVLHIFGIDPGLEQPSTFLKRLAGLVKFSLRYSKGVADIGDLACALAQREMTVQIGLSWLQGKGVIRLAQIQDRKVILEPGTNIEQPSLVAIEKRLVSLLKETNAYRTFFQNAEIDSLL